MSSGCVELSSWSSRRRILACILESILDVFPLDQRSLRALFLKDLINVAANIRQKMSVSYLLTKVKVDLVN